VQAGKSDSYDAAQRATPEEPTGRVAGIDYGTKRIGIALSDPGRTIASPWETYVRHTPDQDAQRMKRLVAEQDVQLFVVGLPLGLDGGETAKSREARAFGRWLAKVTGVPVEFFDERFTTVEAEQLLAGAELTHKRRKSRVDKVAAQILLAAYLDHIRHRPM